jgi:hypothetical protein
MEHIIDIFVYPDRWIRLVDGDSELVLTLVDLVAIFVVENNLEMSTLAHPLHGLVELGEMVAFEWNPLVALLPQEALPLQLKPRGQLKRIEGRAVVVFDRLVPIANDGLARGFFPFEGDMGAGYGSFLIHIAKTAN